MDATVHCAMCRICMRSDSKTMFIEIFEHIVQTESDAETLANIVSLVGAVEVQQDDELPKYCCVQCLQDVEAAYKLRNLCQESDGKLRNAVVKKESFSDDELNSRDPEGLTSSNEVCAKEEVVELNSLALDALKHEYEEITIEETRIIDDNNSKSNQCPERNDSISNEVDQNCSNIQELAADVSEKKPRRINYHRRSEIFDKYPAVKLSCCRCISSFDTIEELRAHGREKHCDTDLEFPLKKTQCDICFTVLASRRAYDFHKRNVMYNYRCLICDQILITLKQASVHSRLEHKQKYLSADQALICCGCEMKFTSAEALKVHSETIHLPEKPSADEKKPITCNVCYRNYSSKRVLRMHKIGYLTRMKNHHCKECGKSYRNITELKYHEQSHIQKTFLCSQCPKVYNNMESLRHHLYLHSQPSDRYRCNECDRSFGKKSSLDAHCRIHTGERPYQCKECGKSFRTKGTLDQHTQLHATTHPYSCPQCPATFKARGSLKAHVTTHTGKQYKCPQCDRQFRSKTGMKSHIKVFHDKAAICSKSIPRMVRQMKHVIRQNTEQASENPNEVIPMFIE